MTISISLHDYRAKVSSRMPAILFGAVVLIVSSIHLINIVASVLPQVFTFPQASATPQNATHQVISSSQVPTFITIEKVNIHLPIVSVPLVNGTWAVNDGVANYAQGTSLVSSTKGNVGIYAHDRENGFTRIKNLSIGDRIEVETNDGYIGLYTITSKYDTMPSSVEVFYPTERPTLTLLTCNGVFSDKRFIVRAELVSLTKGKQYDYSY